MSNISQIPIVLALRFRCSAELFDGDGVGIQAHYPRLALGCPPNYVAHSIGTGIPYQNFSVRLFFRYYQTHLVIFLVFIYFSFNKN